MSAPSAPAAAPPIPRPHLLQLGRAGDPWPFIPRALAHLALTSTPDPELRFLLASSFASLGLPTLAAEQLASLPAAARAHPSIAPLASRLAAMPDDRVPSETRHATCAANLEALATRAIDPIDLRHLLAAWSPRCAATEAFRTTCGNVLLRRDGAFLRIAPDAQDAATTVARLTAARRASAPTPHYLEGACPPWWFAQLASATPTRADGAQTPIHWLCANANELLDGLSLADLRPLLSHPRTRLHTGPEAADRLAALILAHPELHLAGPVMVTPTVTTPLRDRRGLDTLGIIDDAEQRQAAALKALTERLRAAYAQRSIDWYRRRFTSGQPLSVLIPTTRYSTFIQHAAADLAAAFNAAGHNARLLIEPDDRSQLSQVALARDLADHQPDLVVLINYTRASLGDFVPANLPVVTWVQDAMPHLFSAALGSAAAANPFDFIAGHLHPDLFDRFGYPRGRSLATPVLVSDAKFHPGAVEPALARRLTCDVAYVGHQSETAESMAARLAADAPGGADSPLGRAVASLPERIAPIIDAGDSRSITSSVSDLLRSLLRGATGADPAPDQHAALFHGAAMPIAERLLRHQMLQWAANICARRGWSLKLFGNGWSQHPTLAPHAAGPLNHGDELRACYACATVHLHAALCGIQHQRIMECALSGGLPLVRTKLDDLLHAEAYALQTVARDARRGDIPAAPTDSGWLVRITDHPVLMRLAAQRQRRGRPAGDEQDLVLVPRDSALPLWSPRDGTPTPDSVTWLLGSLDEAGFSTEAQLHDRFTHAIESPGWRSSLSRGIAQRTREHLTHARFTQRLISFLSSCFNEPSTP